MGLEIDFLAVGEESTGGDAITVRYGNLYGNRSQQTLVVVDGGFKATGEALVEHIRKRFNTNCVDIVISTHPDQDHASGLTVVLEECEVGQLWMHLPWQHSLEMAALKRHAFESASLTDFVTASLQDVATLEDLARAKGIEIVQPFAGVSTPDGQIQVMGPSEEYYDELVGDVTDGQSLAQRAMERVYETLDKAAQKLLPEDMYEETLTDSGTTSPRNNSSVISLISASDRYVLLSGDAGVPALHQAIDNLNSHGIGPGDLSLVQIPHHGSRRNVGPTVLDRLLGPKGEQAHLGSAVASSPKKNTQHKHPSKKVTNAFRRRGYPANATQGVNLCYSTGAPERSDYSTAEPLPLYPAVEADGDD